jgi:hypothetical protein
METWRVFLYHKIKYKYAKAIGADPTTPGERSVVAFFNLDSTNQDFFAI